jgi:DivIVA domain-containing protein
VALDRQSIEKKDFPVGRRGYDPAAVDAHLSAVAEEVEELRRTARKRTESLASSSSEQVRAIIDAAESSAAAIHRQAEDDAREIRTDATTDAKAKRDGATAEAREYIDKVSQSTADLQSRIDAMQTELGTLLESLKAGAKSVTADLKQLESNLGQVREAAVPGRFEADEPVAPATAAVDDGHVDPDIETAAELYGVDAQELAAATAKQGSVPPPTPTPTAAPPAPPAPPPPSAPTVGETVHRNPAGGDEDHEGARLIALNMALNQTPREETDRYLAENFKRLSDRSKLLDEVYASLE